MKNILFILTIIIMMVFITSCSYTLVPLKGKYDSIFQFQTIKSFKAVWDETIDFITFSGFKISALDRESGFISFEKKVSEYIITNEDESGRIINSNAFLIAPCYYFANNMRSDIYPSTVSASWIVRISSLEDKTIIKTKMVNGLVSYEGHPFKKTDCKSTGVLEKRLFDQIK